MTAPAQPVPRIFVSHSHHDNNFCRPFVAHLRSALGLTDPDHVFYDESSLQLADAWLERIQREVVTRPVFIVILSPQSVVADYVIKETNLALRETITHHERRIYSVLIEPCDPNQLAPMLGDYQMADVTRQGYDLAFAQLVAALRGAPGASPALPPPPPGAAAAHNPRAEQARRLAEEAQAALAAGRWSDAIGKADFALSLPENAANAALLAVLALACAGAGQWERARDAATRALDADPFRVDLWRALARAQAALGRPDEALAALDRARALAPLDDAAATLELLGERRALLAQGQQWAAALATLDDELALAPDDAARLATRLDLLQRLGRDAEALDLLRRLGRDAEALDLAQRLGRDRDALDLARTLTARPDATFAEWLARARLARTVADATDEVRAALDTAARLAPADPALARARQELLPPPIPPERFPQRLADLGFTPGKVGAVEVIVPPVCDVPAGEFLMGSDRKDDRELSDDEKPRHTVTLPAYQIGRYPVTVAEYACFVRAGGKEPPRWEYQKKVVDWQAQQQRLDHPVVCVSWRDATDYAAWLARVTGAPWRLPTEAEWEKAARWDPSARHARIYPWGDAFDQARCNTSGAGKGTTTPVGAYADRGDASPCGAHDMAGNVWEWTSSLYKPYPYKADDGRERADSTENRVLRGGSWVGNPRYARAAYRGLSDPDVVSGSIGFRVARAVPGA